jgi:hypothetical protein
VIANAGNATATPERSVVGTARRTPEVRVLVEDVRPTPGGVSGCAAAGAAATAFAANALSFSRSCGLSDRRQVGHNDLSPEVKALPSWVVEGSMILLQDSQ